MGVIDAGVGDRDRHRGAPGGDVPALGRVDVGVVGPLKGRRRLIEVAERLARVVESRLLEEQRVVRHAVEVIEEVRLRVANLGAALECSRRGGHRLAGRQPDDLGAIDQQPLLEVGADPVADRRPIGAIAAGLVAHDQLTRRIARRLSWAAADAARAAIALAQAAIATRN